MAPIILYLLLFYFSSQCLSLPHAACSPLYIFIYLLILGVAALGQWFVSCSLLYLQCLAPNRCSIKPKESNIW